MPPKIPLSCCQPRSKLQAQGGVGLLLKQDSIPLSCPPSRPTHRSPPSSHPRLRIYGLSLSAAGNHGKPLREASGWSLVSPRLQCGLGWERGAAETAEGAAAGQGGEGPATPAATSASALSVLHTAMQTLSLPPLYRWAHWGQVVGGQPPRSHTEEPANFSAGTLKSNLIHCLHPQLLLSEGFRVSKGVAGPLRRWPTRVMSEFSLRSQPLLALLW